MFKLVAVLFLVLCVFYVLWIVLLYFGQDKLVFPRGWSIQNAGPIDRPGVQVMRLSTDEGEIPAWFFRGAGASETTPRGVVVMLHGNAMAIDNWFELASRLASWGVNVLLPEYRGYGKAPGTPSQDALLRDVVAFIDQVRERPEVEDEGIVIYGRSIGAALGALVAVERPPAGLLLHTPPINIASYAMRYGAPPILIRHPFRTDRALEKLGNVPILIISHDNDSLVPPRHSTRLREIARHAEYIEVGGTHNAYATPEDEIAFEQAVANFIRETIGPG